MNSKELVDATAQLTKLIAEHGIYALTIIMMLWVQARAKRQYVGAAPDTKTHFRRCHVAAVTATYSLITASAVIWSYKTFWHVPQIGGSITRLVEQPAVPTSATHPAFIRTTISSITRDIELLTDRVFGQTHTEYDLTWLARSRSSGDIRPFDLHFRQEYRAWLPKTRRADSDAGNGLEELVTDHLITIDPAALGYARTAALTYLPDPDPKKIGKLYFVQHGQLASEPLAWKSWNADSTRVENKAHWSSTLIPALLASDLHLTQENPFRADGSIDPRAAQELRDRLARADLRTQEEAIAVLVAAGPRAYDFVRGTLATEAISAGRQLLIANIAIALEGIDSRSRRVPKDINLQVAIAFASLQNYDRAAAFFERAGNPVSANDLRVRAVVRSALGKCDEAAADYTRYLATITDRRPHAITYSSLGYCYSERKDYTKAVSYYRRAIGSDASYGLAANNLAFLMANQNQGLTEALRLANLALALESDPELIPLAKDTKGWVFFKLGRVQEALALLTEAAAAAPGDDEIRLHLDTVKSALSGPPAALPRPNAAGHLPLGDAALVDASVRVQANAEKDGAFAFALKALNGRRLYRVAQVDVFEDGSGGRTGWEFWFLVNGVKVATVPTKEYRDDAGGRRYAIEDSPLIALPDGPSYLTVYGYRR